MSSPADDDWNEGWRAANETLGGRQPLTDADVEALRDFFPRMRVASLAKDPDTARAVYKINPAWLPYRIRRQVEASPMDALVESLPEQRL